MNQGPASHPDLPADLEAAVALGSEMGRRFAEFDWAAHPLGRPQDWPAELRTIVAAALTSRFPYLLGWAQTICSCCTTTPTFRSWATDTRPRWANAASKCGGTSGTRSAR